MQWNVKKCKWTDHREQQSSNSSSSRNVPHVNRQAGRHPMGAEDGAAFPLATANPPATQPQETEQRQPHIKLSNLCVHSPQCMPAVCLRHSIRSCLNIYQTFSVFSNLKSLQFSNLKTFFCSSWVHTYLNFQHSLCCTIHFYYSCCCCCCSGRFLRLLQLSTLSPPTCQLASCTNQAKQWRNALHLLDLDATATVLHAYACRHAHTHTYVHLFVVHILPLTLQLCGVWHVMSERRRRRAGEGDTWWSVWPKGQTKKPVSIHIYTLA